MSPAVAPPEQVPPAEPARPSPPPPRTVQGDGTPGLDLHEPLSAFLRRLRTGGDGLAQREAERRLQAHGRNELPTPPRQSWLRAVGAQLVHPLALVLWAAAALSVVAGTPVLSAAIVLVIVINAAFSFSQERRRSAWSRP